MPGNAPARSPTAQHDDARRADAPGVAFRSSSSSTRCSISACSRWSVASAGPCPPTPRGSATWRSSSTLTAALRPRWATASRTACRIQHDAVEQPGLAFDYVLYLGCLLFAVELGYIESQFHPFGAAWDHSLLIAAAVFFALAYRFDNRFVLSLALSQLAGWFGVEVWTVRAAVADDAAALRARLRRAGRRRRCRALPRADQAALPRGLSPRRLARVVPRAVVRRQLERRRVVRLPARGAGAGGDRDRRRGFASAVRLRRLRRGLRVCRHHDARAAGRQQFQCRPRLLRRSPAPPSSSRWSCWRGGSDATHEALRQRGRRTRAHCSTWSATGPTPGCSTSAQARGADRGAATSICGGPIRSCAPGWRCLPRSSSRRSSDWSRCHSNCARRRRSAC